MQLTRRIPRTVLVLAIAAAITMLATPDALAQGSRRDLEMSDGPANVVVDPDRFGDLHYRSSGFSRGGRATAVAGVPQDPMTYYFGGTGAGIWKTSDAGLNWENISDGQFGVGAIGAIAVAPSDPNVLYVGTGSGCPRGNISVGDGIYKSTDGGKTWQHTGLRHAGQIPAIRVHPADPDTLWVAALGHIFGPNEDRGVFRSTDGGDNWEKVLYIDEETGVFQVALDVNNPRILYASGWRVERKPWALLSGNEKGGIWKTTNGGDTWDKLEGGLPTGLVGKIDVTVSPANSDRVWALIEAEGDRGGVYRSDDAGESWRRINGDAKLRQRPWYYIHIFADPLDENTVYSLNTGFYKSIDGGRTFDFQYRVPHGDNHALWINPDNPVNMINGNDGGANVTFNGAESWTWQMNQPTSEIYRVFVDQEWPYRIYGSQQDNSTISVSSQGGGGGFNRGFPDWYSVGGCESGHIAIDPRDNSVVYAGCYGGSISRTDLEKGTSREIIAYPQLQLGQAPRDLKFRFQWNAPIRISPHAPDTVYHTSQVVHKTTDGGQSWEVISPDLTTDNQETQDYAGGPISHDSTGVEVYNTIFAFEESHHAEGLMWAGSDDGKIHLSRDAGANWTDITPADMPVGGTVNVIDLSAHDPGRAHVAVYRYRENDFAPYIFQTSDYGASWKLLTDGTNGIPASNFVRAVREDPERQGLLYAGTEFGMYISFDDGANWQDFQLDLPVTPVTDMQVHRGDLIVSTQGRGFWILDDISVLRGLTDEAAAAERWLFAPRAAYRGLQGGNPRIHFWMAEAPEGEVKLEILNAAGDVVHEVKGKAGQAESAPAGGGGGGFFGRFGGGGRLTVDQGHNTYTWSMREKGPEIPSDVVLWGFAPGRAAMPGSYTVRLSSGDWSQEQPLVIHTNPKLELAVDALQEQYDLLGRVGDRINELYGGLADLRDVKKQSMEVVGRVKAAGHDTEELAEMAKAMNEKLTVVEEQLTQVKSKSGQDPINFPPMLDNQYVELYGYMGGNERPPAAAYDRLADLDPQLDELLGQLQEVMDTDLAAFNAKVGEMALPAVVVKAGEEM
jgi:photosystem II stability/assembly factor-like uncharacterized protein